MHNLLPQAVVAFFFFSLVNIVACGDRLQKKQNKRKVEKSKFNSTSKSCGWPEWIYVDSVFIRAFEQNCSSVKLPLMEKHCIKK